MSKTNPSPFPEDLTREELIELVYYMAAPPDVPRLEVDVDGQMDEKTGIQYIGKAILQSNGLFRCLANVGGALCVVEVRVTEKK